MRSVGAILALGLLFVSGCSAPETSWQAASTVEDAARHTETPYGLDTVRVPYHRSFAQTGCLTVEGRLGGSPHRYPLVLDTGAAGAVFVSDIHVRRKAVSVVPSGESIQHTAVLCSLDGISIGPMTIKASGCRYIARNGQPSDDTVIVGLKTLEEFSYVLADSITRKVELSRVGVFRPADPGSWSQHPLEVRRDEAGHPSLLAELTIAGKSIRVQLDTGSGKGLTVTKTLWKRLSRKLAGVRLTDNVDFYPYIGRLACKHACLHHVRIGSRTVPKLEVSVLPDDSVLFGDCNALLGMQSLWGTTVVLDFRNDTLWVRTDQDRS